MTIKFQDIAKRVIETEANALKLLVGGIDDQFEKAVEAILNARGRVIVSGMGKSGHIARKIAATFASTGTPAHFVHPAEASHGDLGMMAPGDVALILSNSGETPELSDVVAYCRRFEIPLIGVASVPSSTLMRQSDITLVLPPAPEACETGVVPTTSTTMTLALGDALAIALMEYRSFTPQNFRDFHPGGKLGARLSKVSDLMHSGDKLPIATLDTNMSDVLLVISQKGFGVAGIVDDAGSLCGIITDGDLRRHMNGLLDQSARKVMTENPKVIHSAALAEDAVALMNETKITGLFVVEEEGRSDPIGFLHIHDCLRVGLV